MIHFVGAGSGSTGSDHSKRKTVSGGGRCDYLCRISCKSAAFGIQQRCLRRYHNSAKDDT